MPPAAMAPAPTAVAALVSVPVKANPELVELGVIGGAEAGRGLEEAGVAAEVSLALPTSRAVELVFPSLPRPVTV